MKKIIFFDLDGTLLDTLEDLSEAVNHALSSRGLPLHTPQEYSHMVGHGVRNLVSQALEASLAAMPAADPSDHSVPSDPSVPSVMPGPAWHPELAEGSGAMPGSDYSVMPGSDRASLIDAALADFKAYYQAHIDVHTRPYPGIPELLASLQEAGVQLAVVSNKFQEGTEYLIHRFFPGIHFVAILGNRPGRPLKPSPEIVQDVLSSTGISPDYALLVGDSPTDMRTAYNSGIDALTVTWGYRAASDLESALGEFFSDGTARLVHSVGALRIRLLGFYVSEPKRTPPATFETPLPNGSPAPTAPPPVS